MFVNWRTHGQVIELDREQGEKETQKTAILNYRQNQDQDTVKMTEYGFQTR